MNYEVDFVDSKLKSIQYKDETCTKNDQFGAKAPNLQHELPNEFKQRN